MARTRLIKPQFFQHDRLFEAERECGLPLRLAFAGLWCQADREGRFDYSPKQLKLNVLPWDAVDMEAVLAALEQRGFIISYVASGRRYGYIPTFARHQTFHYREPPSKLPPPPAPDTGTPPSVPGPALGSTGASPTPDGVSPESSPTGTVTGCTTGTVTGCVAVLPPDAVAPASPTAWLTPLIDLWQARIGLAKPGRAAAVLEPVHTLYGPADTLAALTAYLDEPRPPDRPVKLEYFAADAARWLAEAKQPVTVDGILTERGRRLAGCT
jgi:hypothetical protein